MDITIFNEAVEYLKSKGFESNTRTISGWPALLILHNPHPMPEERKPPNWDDNIIICDKIMYIWPDWDNIGKWLVEVESTVPYPKFEQTETLKEACDMAMNLLKAGKSATGGK